MDTADYLLDRPAVGWSDVHAHETRIGRPFIEVERHFDEFATEIRALGDRTSSKIHEAFAAQTWRLVGAIAAFGGVSVAAIRL